MPMMWRSQEKRPITVENSLVDKPFFSISDAYNSDKFLQLPADIAAINSVASHSFTIASYSPFITFTSFARGKLVKLDFNSTIMNRKNFLMKSATAGTSFLINPFKAFDKNAQDPEPYKTDIVKEFVIAGHGKLDRVKEMVAEYPNLLYCRYDWGNGDFEEAIEGAGHVGNKEIANYLIEIGARPNLFVLTMLGETAIVKSTIEKYPSLLNAKGAHGLTLLHHATKGGEKSKELFEYFNSKGLKEMQIKIK